MANISWVKVNSDIFQHRKIKQIRCLPDGDSLALIWIQLLCLAGNTNDTGLVYFAENVPYTSEMLSVELIHPIQRIEEALRVFQKYRMIEVQNKVISIVNWEKYQSLAKLDAIREVNRKAKRRQRERQAALVNDMSLKCHPCHATELELDLELEKDKEKEKEKKKDKTKIVNLNSRAKDVSDVPDADDHRGELLELYSNLPGITIIN